MTYNPASRGMSTTALADAVGPATGSDLIGDDNTYSNFTPSATTVKGALQGIDAALTGGGGGGDFMANGSVPMTGNLDLNGNQVIDAGKVIVGASTSDFLFHVAGGNDAVLGIGPLGSIPGAIVLHAVNNADTLQRELEIRASSVFFTAGGLYLNGNAISNVADPVSPQGVATKAYVDAQISTVSAPDLTPYLKHDGSVAIDGSLVPNASSTIDLGSSSLPFATIYGTKAGLGTSTFTDPNGAVALAVQGAAGTSVISATDGTAAAGIYVNNGFISAAQVQVGATTNHDFGLFANNGQPSIMIAAANNFVGIGPSITAPSYQLDVGGTGRFAGDLDMSANQIKNIAAPTANSDAATKASSDAAVATEASARTAEDLTFLKLDGTRSMTGALNLNSNDINNAGAVTSTGLKGTGIDFAAGTGIEIGVVGGAGFSQAFNRDAGAFIPMQYVGSTLDFRTSTGGGNQTTAFTIGTNQVSNWQGKQLTNIANPTNAQDAATKASSDAAAATTAAVAVASEATVRAAEDLTFLKLDGSRPMTGALNAGAVTSTGLKGTGIDFAAGTGIEIGVVGGAGFSQAFNRDAGAFIPMQYVGSTLDFRTSTGGGNQTTAFTIGTNQVSNWQGKPLTNIADPTNAQDAVTKGYTDNSLNRHLKSTQTTAPTIAVDAGAGTGASASIASATDTAGRITITTGTIGLSTGAYATVTFNTAYTVAPICVLTPANGTISSSVYVTSTTTTMTINFAVSGGISSTYEINYHCIETQ